MPPGSRFFLRREGDRARLNNDGDRLFLPLGLFCKGRVAEPSSGEDADRSSTVGESGGVGDLWLISGTVVAVVVVVVVVVVGGGCCSENDDEAGEEGGGGGGGPIVDVDGNWRAPATDDDSSAAASVLRNGPEL